MARPVRRDTTPQPQGGIEESETYPSVPWQEKQRETREGKVVSDYDLDLNCKPEGSDPYIKAVDD